MLRALGQLADLDRAFDGLPVQANLRGAARALLGPEFQRLGWAPAAGETPDDSGLRGQLITQLSRFGDQAVLDGARQRLAAAPRRR